MSTVLDGQARLGGRVILLECKNIDYLVKIFYPAYGFKKIEKEYGVNELIQFIKVLSENELIQ